MSDNNEFGKTIEFNNILEVHSKRVYLIEDYMEESCWRYVGKVIGLMSVKKTYIKEIIIRNVNVSNFIIFKLPYNKMLIKYYNTNEEAKEAYKYYRDILKLY